MMTTSEQLEHLNAVQSIADLVTVAIIAGTIVICFLIVWLSPTPAPGPG